MKYSNSCRDDMGQDKRSQHQRHLRAVGILTSTQEGLKDPTSPQSKT